jgi:hypothetical protein
MSKPNPIITCVEGEPSHEADFTLRDLFAAAALTGILAGREVGIEHVARAPEAFRVADAMLAERAKS